MAGPGGGVAGRIIWFRVFQLVTGSGGALLAGEVRSGWMQVEREGDRQPLSWPDVHPGARRSAGGGGLGKNLAQRGREGERGACRPPAGWAAPWRCHQVGVWAPAAC
jgi:hypothetical protein